MFTHNKVQNTIRKKRNPTDDGFSLIEVVVVMVIIGALGLIGFMAYTSIIGDARDTALDANVSTAAEALHLEASLDPTILADEDNIIQALTERTSFEWSDSWDSVAGQDSTSTVRFQKLDDIPTATAAAHPTGTDPPKVN